MKRIIRLTESDLARIVRRVINEEDSTPIDRRDWANKQEGVIKKLAAQYVAEQWPFTPLVCGPYYLLAGQSQLNSITKQSVADGGVYEGMILGWRNRGGFPSPMTEGEGGTFQFDQVYKFKMFQLGGKQEGGINYMNAAYNAIPLNALQVMWKNIKQAPEIISSMPQFKTTVMAYQKNPTDATKGYNKITGNAAEFLKSLKFV